MKTRLFSLVGVIALSMGCNTVSVSTNQSIAAPTFPATDPASVQILQTPPVTPNVRLGEITLQPSGNPTKEVIQQKMRTAAAA